jgi:hypothetical protein
MHKSLVLSFIISIACIIGLLWLADSRTDALMSVGDCVEMMAEAENINSMTPAQKWETFADFCASVNN